MRERILYWMLIMIEKTRKKKRLNGGFFTVHIGLTNCWITENYALYKDNEKHCRTSGDLIALNESRNLFIKHAQIIDLDDCRYVVDFPPQLSQKYRIRIMRQFHNGRTKTMRFDDMD